jgi:SAM-dependent methyltransferase
MLNMDIGAYYARLADSYEEVYDVPERQDELEVVQERVSQVLQDHRVLELACGTGYWTAHIASSVESVLATDANPAMLAVAQSKGLPAHVQFAQVDANCFPLSSVPATAFSACFAAFWWSHVKREQQAAWLEGVRARLGKDGLLVLIDDAYIEDDLVPVARTDAAGNTYQIHRMPDGERFEVLKNFPTDSALRKRFAHVAKEIRILRLAHYWMLTCRFK